MKLRAFKVKAGIHFHSEKGEAEKEYKAGGEPVHTRMDLMKMFPEKFEEVAVSSDYEEPAAPKKPAAPAAPKATEKEKTKEEDPAADEGKGQETGKSGLQGEPLGEDVTDQFKTAKKNGFLVFRTDNGYLIADVDNSTKAINKKPISKAAVEEYISDLVK